MAKLTTAQRNKLPASKFALPGGKYPINDVPHAINAKARSTQMEAKGKLSPSQKATVDAKANSFLEKHGHKMKP